MEVLAKLNGNEGQEAMTDDKNIEDFWGDVLEDFSGPAGKEKNAGNEITKLWKEAWEAVKSE